MTRRLLTLAAASAAVTAAVAQPPGFPTPVASQPTSSSAVQSAVDRKAKMPAAPTPTTVIPPAPAAAPPATSANTMVIKTAGQPERKVQVLRTERMPDGKVMTEVKDLATGEKYMLMDGPVGKPADAPPATTSSPKSKMASVLVGGKPTQTVAAAASTPRVPTGETVSVPKPTIMSRLFGTKPATPATTAAMPVSTAPPVRPTPAPTMKPMPTRTAAITPPPAPPMKSQPPAMTLPPAPPAVVVPSSATEPPFLLTAPPVPADAIRVALPVDEVPPEVTMKEEVTPLISDLMTHRRPSYRMEAASGLADGRYASRDEIKAVLAKAATTDASPVVRAHCVTLLSNLGYADPMYVEMLKGCASDDSPALSRAARTALEKMK